MASYQELNELASQNVLLDRLTAATAIAAESIRNESAATPNHAARLVWARSAFSDPVGQARLLIWAVLAQNASYTSAQIRNSSDANLLSAVLAVVNIFAV